MSLLYFQTSMVYMNPRKHRRLNQAQVLLLEVTGYKLWQIVCWHVWSIMMCWVLFATCTQLWTTINANVYILTLVYGTRWTNEGTILILLAMMQDMRKLNRTSDYILTLLWQKKVWIAWNQKWHTPTFVKMMRQGFFIKWVTVNPIPPSSCFKH